MQPEDLECSNRIAKGRTIASAIDFKAGNPSGILEHFDGKILSDFNAFSQVNVIESK